MGGGLERNRRPPCLSSEQLEIHAHARARLQPHRRRLFVFKRLRPKGLYYIYWSPKKNPTQLINGYLTMLLAIFAGYLCF